jgi:TIR domain
MSTPPNTCAYTWDVFLSFRRWQEWPRWVKAHFEPLFVQYLGEDLGYAPKVFVDWREREPGPWPAELGRELARSRVLVPLLSRMYFDSPWCQSEFDLVLKREEESGKPLIVPAVIHDGKHFPDSAKKQQSALLSDYANPRMRRESQLGEMLVECIRAWTPMVVAAIQAAPACDPAWEHHHVEAMNLTFEESSQKHVPSWGA